MPETSTYRVRVVTDGWATITAATKKEATEKARRREFDRVHLHPAHAEVSTVAKQS